MSLLKVLTFPDKRLREKSKAIKKVTSAMQDLAEHMFETMYAEDGIGLAAPQVGETIRLIVLDVAKRDPIDPDNVEKRTPDPVAMINPEIIKADGFIQFEEGCLSCPELVILVDRKSEVTVNYLDLNGKPHTLDVRGLKGVCIQHEIDHLNGILLVDKISRLKRDLYKHQRLRIAKEEKDLANIL